MVLFVTKNLNYRHKPANLHPCKHDITSVSPFFQLKTKLHQPPVSASIGD